MTVGVLDAFLATWSRARAAFGDGAPQDGSGYDQSPELLSAREELDDVQRAVRELGGAGLPEDQPHAKPRQRERERDER